MLLETMIDNCHNDQWLKLKNLEYAEFFEGTVAEAIVLFGELKVVRWLADIDGTLLITLEVTN